MLKLPALLLIQGGQCCLIRSDFFNNKHMQKFCVEATGLAAGGLATQCPIGADASNLVWIPRKMRSRDIRPLQRLK